MRQKITSNPIILDNNQRLPMKTLAVTVDYPVFCKAQAMRDNPALSPRKRTNICMVSEAIKAKFPDATHVYTDTSIIRFTHAGIRYWFLPPQCVKEYIAGFDRKEPFKPFKFVATQRARMVRGGHGSFVATHPKGDNRTNPSKRYFPHLKRRIYPVKERVNGVCLMVAA